MSQKWNLQDIRPTNSHRERTEPTSAVRRQQDIGPRRQPPRLEPTIDDDLASIDIIDGNSTRRKRILISTVLSLLIIGAAFFVNIMLGGAELTVYPKFKNTSVQATFTAYKVPQIGELSYELLTLEAVGERQVKATGQEQVSERAAGEILIYNTKQTSSQRLIKNTRFESPDGLIFRVRETIEVPGATKDAKGTIVPGVVSASVFADGTGEQYNLPPSRFTIPGLKGTEQYDAFYGESTVAFTGGFEGSKYKIDEAELQKTTQELHLELRNSLLERMRQERPTSFVLYDDAVTVSFESLPATAYGDELATIKEKAYLSVPMFKDSEFASYIAQNTIPGYEKEPIAITNPLTLTFTYTIATTTTSDIRSYESLDFTLKGSTELVWQFDEAKLAADLVSLPKSALQNVLSAYPAIERASATVRPFWVQKFPENADDIVITKIIGESSQTP